MSQTGISDQLPAAVRPAVLAAPAYHFTAHDAAIKLDQNESPYPLPAELTAKLAELTLASALNRYPDIQPFRLQAELARSSDWPAAGVTVAGGSNVLIQALIITAGIGRRVVTVKPTFSVYPLQAGLLGAELTELPLGPGFSLPLTALKEELARGPGGVLFIAAPAAPTGNPYSTRELQELQEAAGDEWLFVIDEAYHEFAGSDHSELARAQGTVVLRTLSKAAGLAGLRVGYALSSPELARQLAKAILPFSVSAMQQEVAIAMLQQQELLAERIRAITSERDRLFLQLSGLDGVEVFPSVTNFLLFRVADAAGVYAGLLERGVLIRRQDHLPGLNGCLRVSAGLPEENDAFVAALREVMTGQPARSAE